MNNPLWISIIILIFVFLILLRRYLIFRSMQSMFSKIAKLYNLDFYSGQFHFLDEPRYPQVFGEIEKMEFLMKINVVEDPNKTYGITYRLFEIMLQKKLKSDLKIEVTDNVIFSINLADRIPFFTKKDKLHKMPFTGQNNLFVLTTNNKNKGLEFIKKNAIFIGYLKSVCGHYYMRYLPARMYFSVSKDGIKYYTNNIRLNEIEINTAIEVMFSIADKIN